MDVKPIVGPVMALLRSRKVMVALAFLGAMLITIAIPGLEAYRGDIQVFLIVFGSAIIAAIAYEDGAWKRGTTVLEATEDVEEGPTSTEAAIRQIIREALDEFLPGIKG